MNLKEAEALALELLYGEPNLASHFEVHRVCGSIRRHKEQVNDIDIVAIEKTDYSFGETSLTDRIRQLDPEGAKLADQKKATADRFLNGEAIKRFLFKKTIIDLYLADDKTFEVLVLIRTGSEGHNIRLTTLAKGKGLKLKANGAGLVRVEGDGKNEKILEYIDTTENGILQKLLGRVPKPEERN